MLQSLDRGRESTPFARPPDCRSDRPIRVNADVYWDGVQSVPADHRNNRKIIVICLEFWSRVQDSHHLEGKVSECAVLQEGKA